VKASAQIRAIKADDWGAYIEDRRKAMTGSQLQQSIKELLYYDGWFISRVNQGSAVFDDDSGRKPRRVQFAFWSMLGYGFDETDGISDLQAIKVIDGRLVWLAIEVKGKGDTLRPSQEKFLRAAEAAGAVPIEARSVDDIQEWLSEKVVVQ
jgi:hypothetical protein